MSILDLFSMAIKSMLKRKVRTILTTLGVVLGTAAITLMISLGVGVNQSFDELIEQMGAEALRVTVHANWNAAPLDPLLDMDAVEMFSDIPGVRMVTPMAQEWNWSFEVGRYQGRFDVIGIVPEAMELLGFHTGVGGFDPDNPDFQIILSANARYQFQNERNRNTMFGGWSPWGGGGTEATIDLLERPMTLIHHGGDGTQQSNRPSRPITVTPVGMMAVGDDWQTQNMGFMMFDQFIELQELIERQTNPGFSWNDVIWGMTGPMLAREEFNSVIVIVYDANDVSGVIDAIHDLGHPQAWSNTQWIDMQRESTEMLQGLLAVIALVSLVIAAIFIANTMVMSIYERTREIGVMKVIGASIRDIRSLFLIEAGLIGTLGGVIGLLVSAGISHLLNTGDMDFFNMGWMGGGGGGATSVIPPWLYALSFGFSSLIGLVSGFLPARRATKISALAAIKTD